MQIDEGGVNWNYQDSAVGSLGRLEKTMRDTYLQLSGNNPINNTGVVQKQIAANPGISSRRMRLPINISASWPMYFSQAAPRPTICIS